MPANLRGDFCFFDWSISPFCLQIRFQTVFGDIVLHSIFRLVQIVNAVYQSSIPLKSEGHPTISNDLLGAKLNYQENYINRKVDDRILQLFWSKVADLNQSCGQILTSSSPITGRTNSIFF